MGEEIGVKHQCTKCEHKTSGVIARRRLVGGTSVDMGGSLLGT